MYKRYIGDRTFYRHVLSIALPIIIQNGITNFVSMLDNIMVGQVGTVPMSGVSIVNGLLFVFNLCVFGASSGAGIFTAQFHGSRDHEGVRHTFRFKVIICLAITLIGSAIFYFGGETLVGLYLTGDGDAADAAGVMEYGLKYLAMMLWGFLPFALSNTYSSTLRETGETMIPMAAGISAVFVNLILNYTLIFGHFGAPRMGVEGAALATVISRYVELAIVAGWTHLHPKRCPYAPGLYKSLYIPGNLLRKLILRGIPLMCNEILWSFAMTFMNQRYASCSAGVLAAQNITSVINMMGNVVTMTLGNVTGIILGQMMGAGEEKHRIREESRKLIFLSCIAGIVFGGLLAAISPLFPRLYNTSDEIRQMASSMILILAAFKPVLGLVHSCYNTIRAGGKTLLTFINDSGFMWCISVPLVFCLTTFTDLPFLTIYLLGQTPEVLKLCMSFIILKGDSWMQNLTK